MADVIAHQGIVENIDDSHVFVRIVQTSACSSCNAKKHCTSAESKEKIIEVSAVNNTPYVIGDKVILLGETSMGLMAVFLAFVIPFLILIVSLFIAMAVTGGDEILSALISLVLLIPYYIVLWLNRKKIKKNFSFTIKPINC